MRSVIPPPGFEWTRGDRMTMLVRSDARDWLVPLLQRAGHGWDGYATHALPGGRGGTMLVEDHGHAVVVRPYRRGGLPALVVRDVYVGRQPRPFRELCVTETWRARGAPVVATYGAAVRWLLPACYQAWLATRYIPGSQTLWAWLSTAPPAAERPAVLRQVGRAIRRLHRAGGRHPDLNLNNILVALPSDSRADRVSAEIRFIDFDRARDTPGWRRRRPEVDLERLRRSAQKLDPQGQHMTAADLDCIAAAYREGTS